MGENNELDTQLQQMAIQASKDKSPQKKKIESITSCPFPNSKRLYRICRKKHLGTICTLKINLHFA
jgi:hypothetical protein